MSAVYARNAGAIVFMALTSEITRRHLFAMQRDMDEIAAGPSTSHRMHRPAIDEAYARHARTLSARARVLRRGAR